MCGIAGIYWASSKDSLKSSLTAMIKTIHHRGPDDVGYWMKEGFGLAHARLSIHDLSSAGHQPMLSYHKTWVIVLNGEIYNYLELKKQLLEFNNIVFNGNSDTEVLINAIEAWGLEKTIRQCTGMFAFAAYHITHKKLYLVRDRFGEKPLYYGVQNNLFAFASELKAFKPLCNLGWSFTIDRGVLSSYMKYGYVRTPHSIYESIFKLEPGMMLVISQGKVIQKSAYWQPEAVFNQPKFTGSYSDAVNELESTLKKTLSLQMCSDVPLGAFLSGGVDSSAIVALMQSMSPKKIQTFSIGFHDKSFNEAHYAKDVANHIGTDHTELYVTENDALEIIPSLSKIYDEPFADSSQIPTYFVSRLARKKITVSLSGDAGDELFGGYNRYFVSEKIKNKILDKALIRYFIANVPFHLSRRCMGLTRASSRVFDKLMKLQAIVAISKK